MMNRVVVRKFLLEHLPANPLSSSSTRSASATPSEIQSSCRGRSPSRTPSVIRPDSTFPSSVPLQCTDAPIETPVIDVETSPETDTTPKPSSSPLVTPSEVGSSSQKRPRIEDVPQGEETAPPVDPSASAPPFFPLPVMFPQFNPKAGVSNMCKAVNKGDVESLSGRSMESLGGVTALRSQIEEKDRSLAMQSVKMESLRTASLQSYTRGREEGLLAGQSVVVVAFEASPEYAEEIFRQGSSFYADGFTVCAEQFKNLDNLPPNFDFNFLDMRADGFGRMGGAGPSE
ncbi:hypothetical protein Salat_2616400 [Sesamum alatum]|uniref:Uncharacterized protein n=1 Tax=Sesamum alatum TaxID=300844 RepID=A0AAE1XPA3_9LAMI|nr:hypothetical protein Salat_2616400 [Sesamum alatum]